MTALISRMGMRGKLFMAPLVCLTFMLLSGGVAFWGMQQQRATIVNMHSIRFATYTKAASLVNNIDAVHAGLFSSISKCIAGYDSARTDALNHEIEKRLDGVAGSLQKMSQDTTLTANESKVIPGIVASFSDYTKQAHETINLLQSDANAAIMHMDLTEKKYQDVKQKMAAFMQEESSLNDASYQESLADSRRVTGALVVSLLVSLLFTVGVCLAVNSIIMKPIRSTVERLRDMAEGEGDLTGRLEIGSRDELGELARLFNTFVEKLHGVITEVSQTSLQIASASNQLQATSRQIATGADALAGQANMVATSGEEMSQTSNDIARNCTMAAEASQCAMDSANAGAGIVEHTITGMKIIADRVSLSSKTVEALGARSDQVGTIVGTIEDIADQTNLLALNAAIEAARAGEQGRGFAVVADEVRALAERTTRATREIGEKIKTIQKETREAVQAMVEGVKEVENGAVKSQKSGQALEEIQNRIGEVFMQINQIATATEQQTATTTEVANSILQITTVAQQTARGADETSCAAALLAGQATQLQTLVGSFKLA
jgi:methyl-accepting chemotaxis protein